MKSDNYLNLCLEQASLSTLRYRHGCIVVKGGKVIGKGYNDYRPGYDGGALKTGQLPKASALANQPKSKSKPKSKLKPGTEEPSTMPSDFVPFETVDGSGGGYRASQALTMHSETMAINSALASSSRLAASTLSHLKPHFKLPGNGPKSGRLLRRDAVSAYIRHACLAAQGQEVQARACSPQGQEWHFEEGAYRCDQGSEERRGQLSEPQLEEPESQKRQQKQEQEEREAWTGNCDDTAKQAI
jgi:deoxycytidylate deaminase